MTSARPGLRRAVGISPVGTVVLAVAVGCFVLLGAQVILGASSIGIGIDEYIHVLRFDEWLRSGWYVPSFLFADDAPDPSNAVATPFVYGAAFSVIAHFINVVAGNESIGEISTEANAYAVRHLVGATIGLVTTLCVGGTVWTLTRNWVAAIWAGAALLAIPAWTGYSMFSNKDVPVAAGYTMVTLALVVRLSWTARGTRRSWTRLLAIGALVAFGVFIAAGTRPAMWLPFTVSLGLFAGLVWLLRRSGREVGRALVAPVIGLLLAVAIIGLLHPRTAADPFEWLMSSVTESADYSRDRVFTLTAGQFLDEIPPRWYLPVWVLALVPVLLMVAATVGAASTGRGLWCLRTNGENRESSAFAVGGGALLVALQLALLPLGALVIGSASYSGLRQHLYVLPPIAVFAGIGAAWLLARAGPGVRGGRYVRWPIAAGLCLALVIPGVEQSRLYPYNYVYINPIAGIGGVEGRWETENQFIAAREAFGRVPPGVEPLCSLWLIARSGETPRPVIGPCGHNLAPYLDEVGKDATAVSQRGKVWVIGRMRADGQPPPYCRERDNVTRPLRGEDLVMAYVLECSPPGAARAQVGG